MSRAQARRIAVAVLLALIGLTGTTALGFWQYSRAHRDDIADRVLAAAPVSPTALLTPGQYVPETAFGHQVRVVGELRASATLLSCERTDADGTPGCWLLAPMSSDDRIITVVLGFVPRDRSTELLAQTRATGDTETRVMGRVQPAELMDRGTAVLLPSDTVGPINVNELAMRWGTPLLDGYVVVEPAVIGQPATAALILPPSGITWRNLIYAWQWWAFAAFVVFLLGRYIVDVRQEAPTIHPASEARPTTPEEQP